MNLAISNIAWDPINDEKVLNLMNRYGFKGVELAPTKYSMDLSWDEDQWLSIKRKCNNQGVKVVAFQALLYGRDDLNIFGTEQQREDMIIYLKKVMRIAQILGAKSLVFGSPKNRYIEQGFSYEKAYKLATEFFGKLGDAAREFDTCICVEANPEEYNCNFLVNTEQVAEFVRSVNSEEVKLHIDTGEAVINKEDLVNLIRVNSDILNHFHVSESFLNHVNRRSGLDHAKLAAVLREINYKGWISIEMRAQKNEIEAIEESLKFVSSVYYD